MKGAPAAFGKRLALLPFGGMMGILLDSEMYSPATSTGAETTPDEKPASAATPSSAPTGSSKDGATPTDGSLSAWAASLALKGIEKVKTDPLKLYDEVRALLAEGNLPAAKRKMMLFKKWTEGTSDLEILKMREEIRAILREVNLAAVEELKKTNETLLEQRLSHLDFMTPHFVHEKMAEKNGRALDLLAGLIKKGSVDTIEEGLKIVKPLMADDPDLMWLIELETREGLRDIDTPEKMKKSSLEVAKELRHRDGSYAVAEGKLKTVLEDEIREAMASITPDEAKSVRDEVHHKIYIYNRVREKAIEALDKLKEEDPEKFKEEYPESSRRGFYYEDELKRKMNESYAFLVEAAKEKFALKKVGEKYEAGKIIDPVAREAWLTLDRMKDPADQWLEMSDATWDRLIDEAVVMAATGVVAAGAGSVTRFGVSALTRSLTARGGAWALAARGTSFAAVTAAESLAMEGVNYAVTKEFDPKNLAFNALTSFIFHGGPALARGLGFVDEAAKGAAAKAKNLAGILSVQTLLDTGVGYLHDATIGHGDERTLWERLFQGALRMGGFRAIGVLTGHATTRMEILTKVRDEAAGVRFRWLKERGYSDKEAASLAAKYAKGVKLDPKNPDTISYPEFPEISEYNKHLVDFEANMNEAMARMGALGEVRHGPTEAMAAVERALESRIKLLEAQAKLGKEFADPVASESAKAVLAEIRGMKTASKSKIIDVEASEEVVGKGKKPAPKKGKPNRDLIAASATLAAGAVAVFAEPAHAAVVSVTESLGHWGPAAALGVGAGLFAVGGVFSWAGGKLKGLFSRSPDPSPRPAEGETPRVERSDDTPPINGGPYREPPPPPARGRVLSYHENGRPKAIELSSDQTIQGHTLTTGSVVHFHKDGKLESAVLGSDHTIDGIPCKKGAPVFFYENGKLKSAYLVSDHTIDGIPCEKGGRVFFYENGKLESAHLASDHTIDGIPCEKGAPVFFYEDGKLRSAIFASDHTIDGIPCRKGAPVFFYENGKLELAHLASDHTINGIRYLKGTLIRLDLNGRVVSSRGPERGPEGHGRTGDGSGGGAAAIGLAPFMAGDVSPLPGLAHAVVEHLSSATDTVINGGLALVADLAAGSPGPAFLVGGAIAGGAAFAAKHLWDAFRRKTKGAEEIAKEIDDLLATSPRVSDKARETIRKELLAEALRTGRMPARVYDVLPRILEALKAPDSKKAKIAEDTESGVTVELRDEDVMTSDTEPLPAAARRAITLPPEIAPSSVHTRARGGLYTSEGAFLNFGPMVFPRVAIGDVTLRFHTVRYPAGTFGYEVSYVGGPLAGKDAVVRLKRPGIDDPISVPRSRPGKADSEIPVREGDVLEVNGRTFRFAESRRVPSVKDLPFPDARTLEARLGGALL